MNELFGLQAEAKPLVGCNAKVPAMNGRFGCHRFTKIIDQSPCGNFIRVKAGAHDRPRWISVTDADEIRDKNGAAQ